MRDIDGRNVDGNGKPLGEPPSITKKMSTERLGDEELKPCPFCGGIAEYTVIEEGDNETGECIECTQCLASSSIMFPVKEDVKELLIEKWNKRQELLELRKGNQPTKWMENLTRSENAIIWSIMILAFILFFFSLFILLGAE
jgi:Lar family restriction alleviation protein